MSAKRVIGVVLVVVGIVALAWGASRLGTTRALEPASSEAALARARLPEETSPPGGGAEAEPSDGAERGARSPAPPQAPAARARSSRSATLAERFPSTLEVQSAPGQGTTVTFRLPVSSALNAG